MLRKFIVLITVILIPFYISGSDMITKDDWSYKEIKSLIDAGVINKNLDKDTITRSEAVEYIKNGVNNILYAANKKYKSSSSKDIKTYIEKLYKLIKAYQTDLIKTGEKLDSIIEVLGDLKVKKAELEKKQDRLLNLMGLRINGESSAYMTDVLIHGSKYITANEPAKRYRPITQYIDLQFSLHASKELYAEATFRLENLFGGFWGSQDIYGLKRFFVQGEYPIAFVLGDYQGKLTPFTLWAVDDERPFEAKVFKDKREMNKKELYLLDNTWPLNGGKLATIVELFNTIDINVEAMLARLEKAGRTNYKTYLPGIGYVTKDFEHDQYLLGGRILSDFGTDNLLKLGANFSEIIDAKDTGDYDAPVLDNYVASGEGELNLLDGILKIKGEYAMSWYTGDKWVQNYITDSALKAGVEVNAFDTKLEAFFKNVGNSFTAYAAQTRIYNEGNNEFYLTQNSTWNISKDPPAYEIGGKVYPFTKYNPVIIPSYNGIASLPGNLLFAPIYENNTDPYGDATPNRQGFVVKLSGKYGEDVILEPLIKFEMANEIEASVKKDYPKYFTVVEGGGKISFWKVELKGGYKYEDTNNYYAGSVAFTSNIIDAGINFEAIKKKLNIFAGYRGIAFNGYEYTLWDKTATQLTNGPVDYTIDSYGGGIEYKIAKPAVLCGSFTNTKIEDLITPSNSYEVQELDVKVSINF